MPIRARCPTGSGCGAWPTRGPTGGSDLEAVLDAGFVCHLGLEVDGWPMVVPTTYGRRGDDLYLHGSVASRSLRTAKAPVPVCVTVTLVDGLVLARSLFNHSVNYRCAMVYGLPELLDDPAEKLAGLEAISDHVVPGQWGYARSPSAKELAATTVLRLSLDEASVKISEGPPGRRRGRPGPRRLGRRGAAAHRAPRTRWPHPTWLQAASVPEHIARGPLAPGSGAAGRPRLTGSTPWIGAAADAAAQATNLDSGRIVHAVGLGHRLVDDGAVDHVDPLGQCRVLGHRVLPPVVGDVRARTGSVALTRAWVDEWGTAPGMLATQ